MPTVRLAHLVLLGSTWLVSCREPTQARLEITTDVDCRDRPNTSVTVGFFDDLEGRPPATVTTKCDAETGRIGSLVVAPGGAPDGDFALRVVTGLAKTADECVADDYEGGCIVARRSLHFLPGASLFLPITLEAACIDVPCGATQTCRSGRCVSAEVDPEDCLDADGCDVGPGDPSLGGGGGEPGDETGGATSGGAPAGSGGASSGGSETGGTETGGEAGVDPCTLVPETCNGLDDDCDGRIDHVDEATELCPSDQICVDGACSPVGIASCESFQLGDHAYALCTSPLTWPDARASCEGASGTLVEVDSATEARELKQRVAGAGDLFMNHLRYYPTCTFVWDDDSRIRYQDWAPGKPDGTCFEERCVVMSASLDHAWDDGSCDVEPLEYVCEWASITSKPAPPCDPGVPPERHHGDGDGYADVLDDDDDDDGFSDLDECFPGSGATALVNGSFDVPPIESSTVVAASSTWWQSSTGAVTLYYEDDLPFPASVRLQFASLSDGGPVTLAQDLTTIPGVWMRWSLRHHAGLDADSIEVRIGDGGVLDLSTTLTTTPDEGWKLHAGAYLVPPGQTTTRFSIRGLDTDGGNYVDGVGFEPVCTTDSDGDGCVDSIDP